MIPRPHLPSHYDSDPAESSSPNPQHATEDEAEGGEENIFRDMTLDEILEELNARFIINLPQEEMNLVRIYWQAEQA